MTRGKKRRNIAVLVGSDYTAHPIASRDRLRWDRDDPEWGAYLQQHLLDNLSDADSRWFLHQVPIDDEGVVDSIAANAGGVPLYLDMCVSIYEDDVNAGRPFEIISAQNGEKIISRYIRHLNAKDKNTIRILAAPEAFDLVFASRLLQKHGIAYEPEEMEMLLDKSIFLKVDEQRDLWKVDESVRLHQRETIGFEKIRSVLDSMLDCVLEEPVGKYYQHLALVLETVGTKPALLDTLLQKCIRGVEAFADIGLWNELHEALAMYAESDNEQLKTLAAMEEIVYLRRTGRLMQAQAFIEAHPLDKETLGVCYYMYAYHKIQIRHLLGHYDESLAGYAALKSEMDLIRPLIPEHIYLAPAMKYADLLFLKGRFDESLALVGQLLDENGVSPGDQIELLRIKGHIYRFRQQYAEAELIYRSALRLAEDNDMRSFTGKLYTNMAEVLCVRDPMQALDWYAKAEQVNSAVENYIELGKAMAAASAAYTKLGDYENGVLYGNRAVSTAEKTGYLSGKAFGLVVLCYAYKSAGNGKGFESCLSELREIIGRIGVYEYLLERVQA